MQGNQGKKAFRNDFQVHTDDELVSMLADEEKQRQAEEEEQEADLRSIASLNDHPGYKIIRQRRLKAIEDYRSGKVLAGAILDAEITNAKIGELARVTNLVADELEKELNIVEAAVEARKSKDGRDI